ncbi:helix-turn-helix domain-containing protein [Flavobacteriaceae bacterium R38]|nr:helix-turn-helix domain-containing protein [Flavobacteriaceae bacterium R38]
MKTELALHSTEFLLHVTAVILVFMCFLFAVFLFTKKSENRLGNTFLGLFMLVRGIDATSIFYGYYIDLPIILESLRHDIGTFFQPPLLYLFVLSVVYSDFKLKRVYLWHIVPFLLSIVIFFPRLYLPALIGKPVTATIDFEVNIIYWMAAVQRIGYIIAIFVLLKRYKTLLLENYAVRYNYRWLYQMNIIIIIIFILSSYKNIYKFVSWGGEYTYVSELRLIVIIAMLLFNCWLVLKALYAPNLFSGIDSNLQLVLNNTDIKDYNDKENSDISIKIAQLEAHMSEEEPYLNPEITIKDIAENLNIKVTDLSIIINNNLKQNFYEFINNYRVEKAKELLKSPKHKQLTILEILYQVGYNSKSSFNTSFKNLTGQTPTEYRKRHQ